MAVSLRVRSYVLTRVVSFVHTPATECVLLAVQDSLGLIHAKGIKKDLLYHLPHHLSLRQYMKDSGLRM